MKRATRKQVFYVREFLRLNSPRVEEPWFHEAVAAVLGERDEMANRDARQRAEIRDLKARLKAVRPHIESLCINAFSLSGCACDECKAHRAADATVKDWRKP